MASKGKGKSKLKKHEIKCESRSIDLKRFAYDVIVYSALRFEVPRSCICIWEGSENDYGYPEFCLVMSRLIIGRQIGLRYTLHKKFKIRYESNKLESFESVGNLLQDVIKELTTNSPVDIFSEVETSLSIACELILFLYSINSNLYLKELAEYWFDCYFHLVKKKFEKEGGLDSLYQKGNFSTVKCVDPFHDQFISANCLPYEDSAKIERLLDHFLQSARRFNKKITEMSSLEEVVRRDSPRVGYVEEHIFEVSVPLLTSTRVEASRIDVPENTGLGIRPHEELLRDVGVSVADATSQNLPGASPQETVKHRIRSSGQQKRQKIKSSLCTSVKQGLEQLSLDSSGKKQSSKKKPNVSVADDPTPSRNLLKASPQESAKHRRGTSGLQTSQSSLCTSVEQGLGQLSLDSSGEKQSNEKKPNISVADDPTPSQNLPSRQEPAKEHSQEKRQKRRSNSGSSKKNEQLN